VRSRISIRMLLPLLCIAAGAARGAFTLEPPVVILKADMGENMAWVDVVHAGGGPMAIEMMVLERELTVDGEPVIGRKVISPDFVVYPSQLILQPRERAKVQVAYKHKKKVTADKAYTLYSKEVPLPVQGEIEEVRTGVNTLVEYYSVIAFETGKQGKLTFVSSKLIDGGKVEVIAENKSNGRVSGEGLVITIGGKEKIRNFSGKKNSIMPGQQRRFTFDYKRALTVKEVSFGNK